MNISSVIVNVSEKKAAKCKENLAKIKGVEIGIVEGSTIILSVEAESTDEEVAIYRQIERTDGVISAAMHYAYFEDELRDEMKNMSENSQEILNDDEIPLENLKYSGSVNALLKDKKSKE